MKKILPLLTLSTLLLLGKSVEPKVMRAYNDNYHEYYSHSSHRDIEDEIISSTAEASSEATTAISLHATTEITSKEHQETTKMSYLDNNRMDITQDIAQGDGEHLQTLLSMMEIPADAKNLEKIQEHFDELIYLSHNDFLNKLQTLI